MLDGGFADYRLGINGLIENPVELDLSKLKAYRAMSRSPSTSAYRDGPVSPTGAGCQCQPFLPTSGHNPKRNGSFLLGETVRLGDLLRRASHRTDGLPPDHACLRHERRAAHVRARRSTPASERTQLGSSSQVDQRHRIRCVLLRNRWRIRWIQPRPRILGHRQSLQRTSTSRHATPQRNRSPMNARIVQ
jgi:hypothetical protein